MLKQNCPCITNDMEDVALRLKLRMVYRVMWRVMQPGKIELRQFKKITHGKQTGSFKNICRFIKLQLGCKPSPMQRIHTGADLKPYNRSKLALFQLRFDHLHQIVSLFFILFGIGISGNPEDLA